MSIEIGAVKAIVGKFWVHSANGESHIAVIGEMLHEGDRIVGDTANASNATLSLDLVGNTNKDIVLGANDVLMLDQTFLKDVLTMEDARVNKASLVAAWDAPSEELSIKIEDTKDTLALADTEMGDGETAAGGAASDGQITPATFDERTGAFGDVSTSILAGVGAESAETGDILTVTNTFNLNDAGSVTIVGTATQGETLTTTLSDPDGVTAGTAVYTWSVNGTLVTNANTDQSTFTLTQNEVGKAISVSVTYSDAFGSHTVTDAIDSATNGGDIVENVNDAPIANDDFSVRGLSAEYYGYSEGSDGINLTTIAQIRSFMANNAPDALFTPTSLAYALGGGDLGGGSNLQTFLGADTASLTADPSSTSDAIIHMSGFITLDAGTYNFKVTADDGYTILIDGVDVATVNNIQSPTGTVHNAFSIAMGGEHLIEIIYWDQGGQYQFEVELQNGSSGYNVLNVANATAMLQTHEDIALNNINVLGNDTDLDGDTLTVTAATSPNGVVVINPNGTLNFTPTTNFNGNTTITYSISDGHGGTDTAEVHINVISVIDASVITIQDMNGTNAGQGTVYESAMSIGTNSSSNGEKFIGQFTISDVEGLQSITIGGATIMEADVGNGTHYNVDHGYITIDWFTPNNGEVGYTYTLTSPTSGDTVNLPITIGVTDINGVTTNGILNVQVIDDAPTIENVSGTFIPSDINTNLMLTLDLSGSMNDPVGGGISISKLAMAKDALANLVDKYDALGNVKVMLVVFSDNAARSNYWGSASEIKSAIADLTANGNTNYDAALAKAMEAFLITDGKLVGTDVQNISYFLSDGTPNRGMNLAGNGVYDLEGTNNSSSGDRGVQESEEIIWTDFLKANDILSHAIGINVNAMNPIAYDGIASTNINATLITSLSQLDATLAATVPLQPFHGTLSGNPSSAFGADGGYVRSFSVDGITYTYTYSVDGTGTVDVAGGTHSYYRFDDPTNTIVLLSNHGSTVTVNMDTGDATFTAPRVVGSAFDEIFTYTLVDHDGDVTSTTPNSAVIHVDATPTATTTTNLFGNANNNAITGSASDETLIGGSGNDTLNGNNGNDTLIGGAGTDTVNGGEGNDTLIFDGVDTLRGDAGIDTVILLSGTDIDFTALASNRIQNIETIDLSAEGDHKLINLTLQDVIDMTDANHTLTIKGDSGDEVNIPTTTGTNYSVTQTTDAVAGLDVYTYQSTNANDPTVILKIEQDVPHV